MSSGPRAQNAYSIALAFSRESKGCALRASSRTRALGSPAPRRSADRGAPTIKLTNLLASEYLLASKASVVGEPIFIPRRADWLIPFRCHWLLRGARRTFSPFHHGAVTIFTLEVGAAGDGDNRDHSFSAFRAARCSIHERSSRFFTRNRELELLFLFFF
jgi:hypothetical protein